MKTPLADELRVTMVYVPGKDELQNRICGWKKIKKPPSICRDGYNLEKEESVKSYFVFAQKLKGEFKPIWSPQGSD